MQRAVLYEGGEDKDEADGHEQVHGGHVRHFRKRFSSYGAQCGHGQHSSDACVGGVEKEKQHFYLFVS